MSKSRGTAQRSQLSDPSQLVDCDDARAGQRGLFFGDLDEIVVTEWFRNAVGEQRSVDDGDTFARNAEVGE